MFVKISAVEFVNLREGSQGGSDRKNQNAQTGQR